VVVVEPIPLKVTPFYDLDLTAADLHGLSDRYPDLDRAFVQVHLTCEAGDDVVALQRQIRQLCPRCLDIESPKSTAPRTIWAHRCSISKPCEDKTRILRNSKGAL
jgi:hypothetical protein